MRKFFYKSIIFIAPLVLIIIIFEYNLGKIPNSYNTKRKNLEAQLDSIEVLVLGSSQSFYGINPEYFDIKGFNLSNTSQSLFYDKELALRYLDKMPKLKCVIISVSYFSFGFQLKDSVESWRDYYYSQFWQIYYPEDKWYDINLYSKIFLYTPKKSVEYASQLFKVNLAEGLNQKGWHFTDNAEGEYKINDRLGKTRVDAHTKGYKEIRFSENTAILEQLISEIKRRNIEPVIITTP